MTCRELIDFLMQYLDGELSEEQRREFDRHLAVCKPCVDYLANYRQAVALGRAALAPTEAPIPATVPEDLVKAVLAAIQKPV